MKQILSKQEDLSLARQRSCINIANAIFEFEPTKENPDEDCINCILDDILNTPEGELRDGWIKMYRNGLIKLECKRTRKSYIITQEFFDKICYF